MRSRIAAASSSASLGFTEWTSENKLRHPRYLGLRRDKDARDVVREEPRGSRQ